jgi:hypothetical protein
MKNWNRKLLGMAGVLIAFLSGLEAQDLYTIAPLPFNTRDYDEFSLTSYKDGYVFCTNRTPNAFIFRLDSLDKPLLDLYFVKKKDNQKWASPDFFSPYLNSKYHEGPFCFSKDFKTIYFTRNTRDERGIMVATFNGLEWENETPFIYNDRSSTGHPFLSEDGTKLFFVSDRRGGLGGFDIYLCTLNRSGRWNAPRDLGADINSAGDELYPCYKNNKLYFASNRAGGSGNLDIYFSMEINGKWLKPTALPAPINSPGNDFSYIPDSTDKQGFFSTDRNNRNHISDIMEFTLNFPDLSNAQPIVENSYTYEFYEEKQVNTDTTSYKYEWSFGDGTIVRGRELRLLHTFAGPGDYLVQLNVIDTITGSTVMNQASNVFPVRDEEQAVITSPDTAVVNEVIHFDANKSYLPDRKIQNYYWDFDDGQIAIGNEVTHKFVEPAQYVVKIGVTFLDENNKLNTECRQKSILIKKK